MLIFTAMQRRSFNLIKCSLFSLVVLAFSSCHLYTSEVPLGDEAMSKSCSDIEGEWIIGHKKDSEAFRIINSIFINEIGQNKYHVNSILLDKNSQKNIRVDNLIFYRTEIDSSDYLNFKLLGPDPDQGYFIGSMNKLNEFQFELSYVVRDFDKNFESSNNFIEYVKENKNEFNQFFDTIPIPFYSPRFYTWDVVMNHSISEIASFRELKDVGKLRDFKSTEIGELKKLKFQDVEIEKLRTALKVSHISNGHKPSFEKGYTYGVLEFTDGTQLKVVTDKQTFFYNLSQDYLFVRKEEDRGNSVWF